MTSGDQQEVEQQATEAIIEEGKPVKENGGETTERSVENIKHPLERGWSMWVYRETSRDWGQGLVELTSFDTVEDYWCLYHHTKLPSELGDAQLSVFKQGVRPAWEHPANKRGGRWLLTIEKRHSREVDSIWTDMVLLMIGENFGGASDSICGAVVNAKAKNNRSKLAIWVANKNHVKEIMEIGMKLKEGLRLPYRLTFHAHNSNSTMFTL